MVDRFTRATVSLVVIGTVTTLDDGEHGSDADLAWASVDGVPVDHMLEAVVRPLLAGLLRVRGMSLLLQSCPSTGPVADAQLAALAALAVVTDEAPGDCVGQVP